MRVAALYDIHGNLPALEAVLEDVRNIGVDHTVVGGDVVPGPMPKQTLGLLRDLDIPVSFIQGNGDRVVAAQMAGIEPSEVPEPYRETMRWNAQQLDPEDGRLLGSWAKTLRLEIAGAGNVLFCHAAPQNDTDIFTRLTPEERLLKIFEGLDVSLVVCGHTHMQFDRTVGKIRVVNAGSVGMPFGNPGAYWLLLAPDVELRHTIYDLSTAAGRIRDTDYPEAESFAARNILQPPAEEEMLRLFTR